MLQGRVCEACGSPVDARDHFCTACGMPQPEMTAPPTPVGQGKPVAPTTTADATIKPAPNLHSFQCQNCSATITLEPGTRSYVCPFCESTYVVELPQDPNRQRPEFIVGFALDAGAGLGKVSGLAPPRLVGSAAEPARGAGAGSAARRLLAVLVVQHARALPAGKP